MVFYCSKKYLKDNLFLGILQLLIGIFSIIIDLLGSFFQYVWLIIGILTLIKTYNASRVPYITLKENVLEINALLKNTRIDVKEYKNITAKKNSLILENESGKKKVWTWLMDEEQFNKLNNELLLIINNK